MSIFINRDTRVIVQGLTGREGRFHSEQMLAYGTTIVGGVTPGKGGTTELGVPMFDTVGQARNATGADASIIFVPPAGAADAILEAVDAGVPLVVCITEGVPTHDMVRVYEILRHSETRLIGPNCPGLITPGECKMGIMPGHIFKPGIVGMVSRSGTLTYEVAKNLSDRGLGQSTVVGIGGDPIIGTPFIDVMKAFENDPTTEICVLAGEIGGSDEETAAAYIKSMTKPVIGFISGRTAPPGKRMGHAGAIVSGNKGTAQAKVDALEAAGVKVAATTDEVGELVEKTLREKGRLPAAATR
ncbi:MAG: succinate--CoA ligase subunit alpha [Candidatus Sericytochromatia bacterium]|nr:succinate--CoA ligase subunit alpha [Candidatus Sericytochromatia bacterium]